jgi:predicted nucleic acid-binding protein
LWSRPDASSRAFAPGVGRVEQLVAHRVPHRTTRPTDGRQTLQRAYELRGSVTPYDAAYVALAEVLDCALLTSDSRLASAPGPRCEICIVHR